MNHVDKGKGLARGVLRSGLFLIAFLPMFVGCYPYDRSSDSDYDVIATTFESNTDFSTKLTYARPDKIYEIGDATQPPTNPPDPSTELNSQVELAVLQAIDDNMTALGYTKVDNNPDGTVPSVVDVHLTPIAFKTQFVGGSCYPYYWDYYYGGGGWCYPTYYTYSTGTILIPMFDPTLPANSPPIWVAGLNGLVSTVSSNIARVRSGIDEAFNQSPYLKH